MISRKARILYDALKARGGGLVDEYQLRDATGLSHGSIVAARRELVELGLIVLERACRRFAYRIIHQMSDEPPQMPRQKSEAPRELSTVKVMDPLAPKSGSIPTYSEPKALPKPSPSRRRPAGRKPADNVLEFTTMPHIAGDFYDFDEWTDAVIEALGCCVDIEESLTEDGVVTVHSYDYDADDTYTIEETEDGITVE